MNWNPFKRIAEIEKMHAQNIAVLSALTDRLNILNAENALHVKRLNNLSISNAGQEARLQSLQDQFINLGQDKQPGMRVTKDYKAEYRRAKNREYARAYYAKKKAAKAAGDAK
jgi:ABC-type phosphate transport system auxiliary subunit